MKGFNKLGILTAVLSLIVGTLFLIIYAITNNTSIAFFGYAYLITAFCFNLLIMFSLLIKGFIDKVFLKNIKTIGVMLLNIPIAYLYVIIVFEVSRSIK